MDEDELYLKEILLSKSIEQVDQTNQILFRWLKNKESSMTPCNY